MAGPEPRQDDMDVMAAVEIAKREVLIKLAEDEPWIFDEDGGLYHMIKQMPNGKKTFTIHVQDGKVSELILHTSIKHSYKK